MIECYCTFHIYEDVVEVFPDTQTHFRELRISGHSSDFFDIARGWLQRSHTPGPYFENVIQNLMLGFCFRLTVLFGNGYHHELVRKLLLSFLEDIYALWGTKA